MDSAPGKAKAPQTWNRYSYALSNPVRYIDLNGLEPMNATVRQFLESFMGADLSNVDVQGGTMGRFMTKLAFKADAVTLGETIYLSESSEGDYRARSVPGISLLGHEVAHVIDYQDFGVSSFLTTYFAVEAIPGLLKSGSRDQTYQNISFEKRGAAWERLISTFLRENQDIASKLAAGEGLGGDKNKIADFMIRQISEGKLKLGYQLINGEVVRIQLYPPQ